MINLYKNIKNLKDLTEDELRLVMIVFLFPMAISIVAFLISPLLGI